MKNAHFFYGAVFLLLGIPIFGLEYKINTIESIEQNNAISNETTVAYKLGVDKGIINPEKYSLESFDRDESNTFKNLYQEFVQANISKPITYHEWLIMNNFGILSDSQESLLRTKFTKRSTASNKKLFVKTVRKGDILIAGKNNGGLLGHAALMTTDYWVLEMRGGSRWMKGIPDNNRQLGKDIWYEKYESDWIKVFRCPDNEVAREAAIWADHHYYNPVGGGDKTIHVTYKLTDDLWKVDPSYNAKLVIQAYYFGPGRNRKVVRDLSKIDHIIFPVNIPAYFRRKYALDYIDEF